MKKILKHSGTALVSLFLSACGDGEDSPSVTPINQGHHADTEEAHLVNMSRRQDEAGQQSNPNDSADGVPHHGQTIDFPVGSMVNEHNPSSDTSVLNDIIRPDVTENVMLNSDQTGNPHDLEQLTNSPVTTQADLSENNAETPPTTDNISPPSAVDTEKPSEPLIDNNGRVENLYSTIPTQTVFDEDKRQKIAVIDTDFSVHDTGDAFITNGTPRLILNQGVGRQAQGSQYSHGTQVAGVIAAHNNTSWIYGYSAESNGMTSPSNLHFETAYALGARIFNNSYGITPRESVVKEKGWAYLTNHLLYKQLAKMAEKDSIFIWAAGNDGQNTAYGQHKYASTESHIPVVHKEAQKGWITVASVTGSRRSGYSSRVGEEAKNWGIAAPGDWHLFNSVNVQGTSFAAPVVAAAVASVWEKFPWMSHHLVTQTILSTADQLGSSTVTTGPNADIGWGVLNVNRALKGPARFDTRLLVPSDNGFVTADFSYRQYADSDRLTWSNDIAGDAGFRKRGTGTLYLSGNNRYTGETLIEGGTLGISNALTHSAVTVGKNATLLVNNDKQQVQLGKSVTNNGTFHVYGQGVTIQENYTADKDARTVIDIHTARLQVNGTADMQGSRILADVEKINEVPTQAEQHRTILKANRLLNYRGAYTVSDHIAPYIEVSRIAQQGNEIVATYKRNSTEYVLKRAGHLSRSAANTGQNVDKVLDEVATTPNSRIHSDSLSIIRSTPLTVAQTVDSLTAEIYASSQNLLLNESRIFSQTIADRAFHALESATNRVYTATNLQDYRMSQEGYAKAKVEGNQTYLGADKQTDHILFGAAAYHSRQKADFEKSAGATTLNQQGGAVYTAYQTRSGYISAQAGIAQADNKIKRTVSLPNEMRHIHNKVKASLYHLYTELGQRFKFKQGEISPFIGYQFDTIVQKAFNEEKNFGVWANRTQYRIHSYVAGLRASVKWGDMRLNAGVSHRLTPSAENTFSMSARYIGADSEIHLQGISPAKYVTAEKLGVSYHINEAFHLFSEYALARQQGGEKWHRISLGATYRF
uniref:S8 family serine peptidase n=1 Tax=Glaesserella sp. TaxID=2094731 RepID=UPI0035A08430